MGAATNSFSIEKLDSLRRIVNISHQKDAKYHAQRDIGIYFTNLGMYDSAVVEFQLALSYVPPKNDTLMIQALEEAAKASRRAQDDIGAIPYYRAGSQLCAKRKDFAQQAYFTMKIGRLFYSSTSYDSAMFYYQRAQTIFEEHEIYDENHGQLYHYFGSVFKRQGDMDMACEYYQQEVDYGRKYGFKYTEADGLSLMASHCQETVEEALALKFKVLDIFKEVGSESSIAMMHNNIAVEYSNLGMHDSALFYSSLSLEYRRSTGDLSGLCSSLSHNAQILADMGKNKQALELLKEAEEIGLNLGHKRQLRLERIYHGYMKVYNGMGRYKEAMESQDLYYIYRDSVRDAAHQDAIAEMAVAYETEKKEKEILLLEQDREMAYKEKELSDERAEQEQLMGRIYLFGGVFFILISVFAAFKFFESQKQKKTIEVQKMQVEAQNQDILDSMNYASTIQQAIVTSHDYIGGMFREFFIFYKPRDIVSGDFYWAFTTEDGKKMIAVGDCTGHGVPGAMMSMLGCSFLNEMVVERGIHDPGEVLDGMREHIKKALNKEGQSDGIDMALCVIENNTLSFAGANLPIYIVRNGEMDILKGDKMPIGKFGSVEMPFETKTYSLEKFDLIYLFSDGYADQFGGEKGKKFKYQTLRQSIQNICTKNLTLQGNILEQDFEEWKGDFEQVDDVCLIGVQV